MHENCKSSQVGVTLPEKIPKVEGMLELLLTHPLHYSHDNADLLVSIVKGRIAPSIATLKNNERGTDQLA